MPVGSEPERFVYVKIVSLVLRGSCIFVVSKVRLLRVTDHVSDACGPSS